jgi:hypothetical protein
MSTTPACDFKHPEFCTGKDVRAVIPRRITAGATGWKNIYDGVVRHWCEGCRQLNQGGFKYAKELAPDEPGA